MTLYPNTSVSSPSVVYTIAWILFIVVIILAVPAAALIDSQRRKKAQREAAMADEDVAEAVVDADADAEEAVVEAEADEIVMQDDAGAFGEVDEVSQFEDSPEFPRQ